MAIISRTVFNPRNIPCPIRIPGYDATLPLITVAPSQTLDLLTVITEDNLIAAQETLDILIAGGALVVTATFDTATLEQGYDGGGNSLLGVISNNTTQLTTSWNFLNFQTASNSEIFFKDVLGTTINGHVGWDTANTYVDSSTGVQILTSEFSSPKVWLFDVSGDLTTPGSIDITAGNSYPHTRYEPNGPLSGSNVAWESGFRQGVPYYSITMDDGSSKTDFIDFALNGIINVASGIIFNSDNIRTVNIADTAGDTVFDLSISGVSARVGTPLDQVQLQVQGNSIQTSNILEVLKSDNTPLLLVDNTGLTTISSNLLVGDVGTEGGSVIVNGVTYDSSLKVSDIGGSDLAQTILHRHSTTFPPTVVAARSNSNTDTPADVTNGMTLFNYYAAGWAGTDYKIFSGLTFAVDGAGTISNTSSPGQINFFTTRDASVNPSIALIIDSNQLSNFRGPVFLSSGGSIDASSLLQMDSTTQGFLPPRMSTAQRTAISSPAEGLQVYDLDFHQLMMWNNSSWVILG